MAVTGTRQDRFLTLFKDQMEMELQQEGSRLMNLFPLEQLTGQKTYFNKFGKLAAPRSKTNYYDPVVFSEKTFERRQITFEAVVDALPIDILELKEMVSNPTNDIVKSLSMSMGRDMDRIIMDAISGTAVVTSDGVTSNVTLPAVQKIAVSDITYDLDLSAGDKGLTPGKLMKAITLLKQNYVIGNDFVVIAPFGQLSNILAHARASSGDYVSARPLEAPGFQPALAGYLGLNFVAFEDTGLDGSNNELVYVVSRSAVKLGQRIPLMIKVEDRTDLNFITQVKGIMDLGGTRMHEEAVVQIACAPRKIT